MMDRTNAMNDQWNITTGTDVVGSDGEKVGEVVAVQPNYIVVEKGFFFPSDYYIPVSAIASDTGNKVHLNVTKDQALHQGWDVAPAEREQMAPAGTMPVGTTGTMPTETTGTMPAQTAATGYATNMGQTNATVGQGAVHEQPFAHEATGEMAHIDEGETLRVPIAEEELTATKRPVELGEVEINKDVVTEERKLDVPLTEERVRVERRVVDRDVPADATLFQEGTIDVPVRGEEVEVEKRVRQTGEVDITKEAVQRNEEVTGTVRREVVNVEETGDLIEREANANMAAEPGTAGRVRRRAGTEATENLPPEAGENEPWVAHGSVPGQTGATDTGNVPH